MKRKRRSDLSQQIHDHIDKADEGEDELKLGSTISTGSTLLDLAISGNVSKCGGVPGGILVEVFGVPSSGKTVLLCEIAGSVQRQGGQVSFADPEARINKQFIRLFDFQIDDALYSTPSTVPEIFKPIREWQPKPEGKIHGVFADSLAALSTNMELQDKDQYGMRRAKEFSEELRKTCRAIKDKNILMVCSNQVRENVDAGSFGQKYRSPGGLGIGFYASLRLRCSTPTKIKAERKVAGKELSRIIGVETEIEVYKSSIDKPYRSAPLYILYDYGIDDIRANLIFVKRHTDNKVYTVGGEVMSNSLDKAIRIVEESKLEDALRQEVVALWKDIESKFDSGRKPKRG